MREPYVLEFLKIPEPYHLSETDLETKLIGHLQAYTYTPMRKDIQ